MQKGLLGIGFGGRGTWVFMGADSIREEQEERENRVLLKKIKN